jgi:hypothetical protein
VFAHAALLRNAYAGPEFEPFECETPVSAEEPESRSVSGAESVKLANGFITAIDFEVAAALSLCGGWHDDWKSDVYLVRSLQRIADHLKALKAIQTTAGQSRDVNPPTAPTDPVAANDHNILVMKSR